MITIRCSKEEQEDLLRVFDFSESCLFERNDNIICDTECKSCHGCINEHLKWELVDEEINN